MTRVSDNATSYALKYSLGKAKNKLNNLNLKGSSLKQVTKPSDDPTGNVDILSIRSENVDIVQYKRNINVASTQLSFTETAIEDLVDLVNKAKEIAIGQGSDIYNADVRKSVAMEVRQLRNQAIAVGNKRFGNRYIFAGHKTLTRPFDQEGHYSGDNGSINLEVAKDYFVPTNLTGEQVFFGSGEKLEGRRPPVSGASLREEALQNDPTKEAELPKEPGQQINRELASTQAKKEAPSNLIKELETLENALMTNDADLIQDLLPMLDDTHHRLITLQTRMGSLTNAVENALNSLEKTKLINENRKSKIEDADIAELFTDLSKQQNILKATYKIGSTSLNRTLLDFIR